MVLISPQERSRSTRVSSHLAFGSAIVAAVSRVRWEQTARPVFDESTGRWEVRVDPWREFQRPLLSNGDLVDVVHSVDPHL